MRQIPLSSALLTFLEPLEYTEAALSANEDTVDLAQPFLEQIAEWDDVFKRERAGRRSVVRAEAMVAVRNAQLDAQTIRFGATVLADAGADRKSQRFRRFFPVAPSQYVRRPFRKQCEHTLTVIVAQLEEVDGTSPLKPFLSPLTSLAKAGIAALDARTKTKADRTLGAIEIDEWKEGCNTLRLSTYAALLQIAAEKGYPRSWADSFFPTDSAGADDKESEAEPETPKAGGTGTP